MNGYFNEKITLVTGAASGFGLGICERLLSLGAAAVYMADVNEKLLAREAARLEERFPGRVFPMTVDMTVRSQVEEMIEHAVEAHGRLDILFNNAGKPMTYPTEKITIESFMSLIDLNYRAVVISTLTALKHMLRQGSGHVINMASLGGLVPAPFQCSYASTKSAVITFTQCLRYEYEERGILFSQVSPANVATPIFKVQLVEQMKQEGLSDEEIEKRTQKLNAPDTAMPLDTALDLMFAGIEAGDTDILIGDEPKRAYEFFHKDRAAFDSYAMEVGRKRREYYEATDRALAEGNTDFNMPFPG